MEKKVNGKRSASETSQKNNDEFDYTSEDYLLSEAEYEKYVIRIRNMSRGIN
jgi:hypothetical protein